MSGLGLAAPSQRIETPRLAAALRFAAHHTHACTTAARETHNTSMSLYMTTDKAGAGSEKDKRRQHDNTAADGQGGFGSIIDRLVDRTDADEIMKWK